MRKSLYIKFVVSYLVLAFIGFFAVSMFGSSMVHNHLNSGNDGYEMVFKRMAEKTEE